MTVNFESKSERIAYLDVSSDYWSCRITSAHAPHAERLDVEYDAFLHELGQVISDARTQKRSNITGVDANAVLGSQ